MYCTNCGKQLSDGDKFCQNCGAEIEAQAPATVEKTEKDYTAPAPFQPFSSLDPDQGMVNKTVFKGKQVSTGTSGHVSFGKKGQKADDGKTAEKKKGGCLPKLLIVLAVLAGLFVILVIYIMISDADEGDNISAETSVVQSTQATTVTEAPATTTEQTTTTVTTTSKTTEATTTTSVPTTTAAPTPKTTDEMLANYDYFEDRTLATDFWVAKAQYGELLSAYDYYEIAVIDAVYTNIPGSPANSVKVDFLYKNLTLTQVDLLIDDSNFKFYNPDGYDLKILPYDKDYIGQPTPVRANSIHSMYVEIPEGLDTIYCHFYEHPSDNSQSAEVKITIGDDLNLDFDNYTLHLPETYYGLGEQFDVGVDSGGTSSLMIDSFEKTDTLHPNGFDYAAEVFIMTYKYANNGMTEDLLVDSSDFIVLDSNGFTMIPYPLESDRSPIPVGDGDYVSAQIAFASPTPDNPDVMIYYSYDDFTTASEIPVLVEIY